MALPPTRRKPRSLTASAVRMDGRAINTAYQQRWALPWQYRGLQYLNLIPELNYASRFYSRMLEQLRIFPASLDAEGKKSPITSGAPVDVLNQVQDPGRGRSGLLGSYGRLMFVTGEGYLFGRDLETDHQKWQFIWKEELMVTDDELIWRPYQTAADPMIFQNGTEAVAYRFWTPSPRMSGEPDSPIRSAVEGGICEELIILTAAVQATAVSRMMNGILKIPQEISPGPIGAIGDEDAENDPFMADLIENTTHRIENPGSADAALPVFVTAASEYLDQMTWMKTHDPQNDYLEKDLRREAIERIATGADMPVEVLTGLGQANHWAARQIQEDMWRSHGAPIAEKFCDDLAQAYLQPKLEELGYADWQNTVIDYDEAKVVLNPDRAKDAVEAHDRLVISDAALRKELNFDESTAPDEKELLRREALKVREPAVLFPGEAGARGPVPGPATPKPDPAQGPPDPGNNGASRQDGMRAEILGAAKLAVIRCRELAGSRIRTQLRSCTDCLGEANGKPNSLVASLVPDGQWRNLPKPKQLVKGGSEGFKLLLGDYGFEALEIDLMCSVIEDHAAQTLTNDRVELPDRFAATVLNGR